MTIPKTIFFDLDNTLVDHHAAVHAALSALVDLYPATFGDVGVEALLSVFTAVNEELWKSYMMGELTPEELRLQRFESVIAWCDAQDRVRGRLARAPVREIAVRYVEEYLNATTPFLGVQEMIPALAERHVLGVISNGFVAAQEGKLERCGIAQHFRHVIFSEHYGVHKPDPLIFKVAIDAAGVQPSAALYVGDNYYHDIFGAGYAGLRTVWFNPFELPVADEHPKINPDAIVRSIPELATLLGVPLSTTA